MEKIFYTISQTAELVGQSASTVRFWSNRFPKFITPKRNAKGNRLYRASDIEILKRITYYTRECGLSLEATERKLSHWNLSREEELQLVKDTLLGIREQLLQIRETL